jgi:hypothetical protein
MHARGGHGMPTSGRDAAGAETPADLRMLGADDRARTGDINLGKVALYQLSYVRLTCGSRFAGNTPTPLVACVDLRG